MKRCLGCGEAIVGLAVFVATSESQPPELGNRESSERGGPPGPPPSFQPGQVLSPSVRSRLGLTREQEQQLRNLEREVKERLAKILTPEQQKQLADLRSFRSPGPPPDDSPDDPPPGGPGGPPDDPPPEGSGNPGGPPRGGWSPRADESPKFRNLSYGNHPRQVLDFYQATSDKPTPVVFYIHGGGWQGGDKRGFNTKPFLDSAISVVAINYRFVQDGAQEKLQPPVKAPLEDAARALQFVRSKAKQWNLDKKRIGATGDSSGGCSSLWLAFHDDLADLTSDDPIARESTRLYCAAVDGAQVSLDPKELRQWMPNYGYGAHAFGLKNFQGLIDNRERLLKGIKEYSPIEFVSADDPPIGLFYWGEKDAKVGDSPKDPVHSPIQGVVLEEKLKKAGVDVILVYPGRPNAKYKSSADYLIDHLRRSGDRGGFPDGPPPGGPGRSSDSPPPGAGDLLSANSKEIKTVTFKGKTVDAVTNLEASPTSYTRRGKDKFSVGYFVKDGTILKKHSLLADQDAPAAMLNMGDFVASGQGINAVIATGKGTTLTLTGSINVSDNGDGKNASDFSGLGAEIIASDHAKVDCERDEDRHQGLSPRGVHLG